MNYGIQLYSVRDYTEKDFENAVRAVADLGYKGVEFAGFFDKTPKQITNLLIETGLTAYGSHSSFDDLIDNYDATVAFHKAINNKLYIIPYYDLTTQKKIDNFVALVNEIQPRLKSDGITLAYHNHAYELLPNEDSSVPFEQLLYRTKLSFQLDVFWAYVAMKKPTVLIERIKDRLCSIHLKDGFIGSEGNPLGQGEVPIKDILDKIKNLNIPVVVESETCNPDGMTEAKICIQYLNNLK